MRKLTDNQIPARKEVPIVEPSDEDDHTDQSSISRTSISLSINLAKVEDK